MLFGVRFGSQEFVVAFHLTNQLALVENGVAMIRVVCSTANGAGNSFAQIGAQLYDVLPLAQQIGVFLLLRESLCFARFRFELTHIVLQMLDVQT